MNWPSWIPLWAVPKRSVLGRLSLEFAGDGMHKEGGNPALTARIGSSRDVLVV